ncbi:MAG: helicase-related protein, partial [Christensenellales bacterium]
QLIDKYLQNPTYAMVDSVNRASQNVVQYYIRTSKNGKIEALSSLVKKFKGERALIFCNTKAMTENVSKHLRSLGYKSDMLNGDMSQKVRSKVLESFKSGNLQFLVCTDVASRGIDISNLPYVVNYDLPKVNEWYVHRIGRTGRLENSGKAYTIINKQEQYEQLKELAKEMKVSLNELVLETPKVEKTIAKNIRKSNNMCEPSFKEYDELDDIFDLKNDDSYNTTKAKNNTVNAKSNYFDNFSKAKRAKRDKGVTKQKASKKKNAKKTKVASKKHSKKVEHSSKKAKKKIKK